MARTEDEAAEGRRQQGAEAEGAKAKRRVRRSPPARTDPAPKAQVGKPAAAGSTTRRRCARGWPKQFGLTNPHQVPRLDEDRAQRRHG